jgi:hypothetical protein
MLAAPESIDFVIYAHNEAATIADVVHATFASASYLSRRSPPDMIPSGGDK